MTRFARRTRPWLVLAALLAPSLGHGQTGSRTDEYRQSPAVLARYADVPIAMDTPGLRPGRSAFTTHDEMLAHVERLRMRAPHMYRGTLGRSQQGREMPYLVFTAEGLSDPARIRELGRPVVWLIGQQHGNEPAGGEVMLALASALADGELKPLLDRITVVIVPRANPDGAMAFTRTAANGLDPNRDHLLLTLPEVRAIHAKLAELPADVVVDAHEFQVAGTWLSRFQALQKSDAMLLYATHPAVPREITAYAETEFIPAIEAAFRSLGLTYVWYHTATGRAGDRTVSLGGNAPGISRNNFGLNGAVSFLVETRGIGVGMQAYQRRVATHYLAAKVVLEKAAAEPGKVRETVARAREALADTKDPLIVGYDVETTRMEIPLIDPETAADRPVEVALTDTRRVHVTETRPRPAGYIVQPQARAAIEALRTRGVILCAAERGPVPVEAFMVRSKPGPVNRESINPEQAVEVRLEARTVTPSDGAVFVPMAQAAAAVVSASLEPDSPGSFVGVGLVPVAQSGEAPIYRVPAGSPLPTAGRCGS